jgi:AcrR family transcriptional regulator
MSGSTVPVYLQGRVRPLAPRAVGLSQNPYIFALSSGLNSCSVLEAIGAQSLKTLKDACVLSVGAGKARREGTDNAMVYRRTHQVVKRLAARRSAILSAARDAAADGGMAAVQIAPVAVRANVAAGTVYRYFPSKADLISELIAEASRDELAAIRRAADAAPGPSSALAAAVTTVAVHVLSQRKLAWGILAEPVDVDVTASRLASRSEIAGEIAGRIDAAVRAGHLPAQDTALAATALLGALHESLVGPLAPDNLDDPAKLRDAVQTVTLLALRAVGVMDARARGLVVQATTPAKALVGA